MEVITARTIPGVNTWQALHGLSRLGFLDYIGELWREYGDVFQIKIFNRHMLVAIHPDAVRHVNVANRQNYDKLQSYDVVRDYITGHGLLTSTGEVWRRQRKLMSPFYTPKGVQAYGDLMLRDGHRLLQRWSGLTGKRVEIGEEMTFVTAAIILRAMFSMETDEAIIGMKNAVERMLGYASSNQSGILIPLWIPTRKNREYLQARQKVHSYIQSLIERRRALPEADWPNDLLTRLMQARDEETGEPISEDLLRDESITTFFAGHETTARTMTFAWYALSENPHVAARLHAEMDSVLGNRAPTLEDLHHLPYTLQVIKEVLRLYPPAPFYMRDAIGEDQLSGFDTQGLPVLLSPYYTHRHPDFWENPLEFNPDRWTSEREAGMHPYAYHPFAAGQRICIGNNFSLLESHILLALLAREYAPRLAPGFKPNFIMGGTLSTSNGFPMIIERREQ
ncbi:MAG TPA: cytochrome P450 [Anaerolineales bacterium]|nr:cytochrome P450 [Anaerolineales bacterium]